MTTLPRIIAFCGVLGLGFVGIPLGAMWDAIVIPMTPMSFPFPIALWVAAWLLPAFAVAWLLVGSRDPNDSDGVMLLGGSYAVAELCGMACYYGVTVGAVSPLYYGLFGVPVFLLPVVWFIIGQVESLKDGTEALPDPRTSF